MTHLASSIVLSAPARRLPLLLALATLSACSWDYSKLSVRDFRINMCDVLDNFQKNAQDNAGRITDPAARDRAFQDLNTKLGQLAAAKLAAVNAYSNCNEAQLKAAQALATQIIQGLIDTLGGNLKNPLRQISHNVQGNKAPGAGVHQITQNGTVTLVAGATPTNPMQVQGFTRAAFQPTPNGYAGPVIDVQWQVTLPGVAVWNVTALPSPNNRLQLTRQPTGFVGTMHATLIVDGPGVTWPIVVDLPIEMDLSETLVRLTTPGLVPAQPFFPVLPSANMRFGRGCTGGLAVEPEINPASVTRVGDPLTVRVDDGPSIGFSALSVGLSLTSLDLTSILGPGCILSSTPDLILMAPLSPFGTALHTLPIPMDPAIAGLTLQLQAVVLEPTASGARGGMTGGLTQVVVAR